MAQAGGLRPTDLVWHQSFPDWVQAAQVTGLFAVQPPLAAEPVQPAAPAAPAAGQAAWAGALRCRRRVGAASPVPIGAPARRRSYLPWLIPLVTLVVVALAFGLYFGLRDRATTARAAERAPPAPASS